MTCFTCGWRRNDEGKSQSTSQIERGIARGIVSYQSVFSACGDVRELGLQAALGLHQETIDRRDEARRSVDRAHPLSGWSAKHDRADAAHRRQERQGAD